MMTPNPSLNPVATRIRVLRATCTPTRRIDSERIDPERIDPERINPAQIAPTRWGNLS